jgi:hypothetical protein
VTLAGLNGSFGAGYGIGVNADFAVSLDRGKFILTLKAALLLGEGISGSFGLEVGHEAVIQIINLFRRELHKNEGRKVTWMTDEAAAHASKLNLLGVARIDIALIYALGGLDIVMNLYDAMTSTGKGGPIAYTIMNYENVSELQAWCINATPAALGPMLMTLSAEANSFEITSGATTSGQTTSFSTSEAQVLQQKAIARIVNWLIQNATENSTLPLAQQQFQNACIRMNKFGTAPAELGTAYCQNRYKLDLFMSDAVMNLTDETGGYARSQYKTDSTNLGKQLDSYCTLDYGSNKFFPRTTAIYTGPELTQ